MGITTYEDMCYEEELKVVDGDEGWAAACGCWRLGNIQYISLESISVAEVNIIGWWSIISRSIPR